MKSSECVVVTIALPHQLQVIVSSVTVPGRPSSDRRDRLF